MPFRQAQGPELADGERTTGSHGKEELRFMKDEIVATRPDSHCPMLTLRARVHLAPLPAGSIPASRRSSYSR